MLLNLCIIYIFYTDIYILDDHVVDIWNARFIFYRIWYINKALVILELDLDLL